MNRVCVIYVSKTKTLGFLSFYTADWVFILYLSRDMRKTIFGFSNQV